MILKKPLVAPEKISYFTVPARRTFLEIGCWSDDSVQLSAFNEGPLRFYGCRIHQTIAGKISLDFLKYFFQDSFHDKRPMSCDALSLFL